MRTPTLPRETVPLEPVGPRRWSNPTGWRVTPWWVAEALTGEMDLRGVPGVEVLVDLDGGVTVTAGAGVDADLLAAMTGAGLHRFGGRCYDYAAFPALVFAPWWADQTDWMPGDDQHDVKRAEDIVMTVSALLKSDTGHEWDPAHVTREEHELAERCRKWLAGKRKEARHGRG